MQQIFHAESSFSRLRTEDRLSYDSALHYGLFTLDDLSADKSFSVNSPLIV